MVVGLLNHVLAIGHLALLESPLEDVNVGVVLQIHMLVHDADLTYFLLINLH